MQPTKDEEKTCENCRYFSQHYSKQGTKFDTVYCGHCLKRQKDFHKKSIPHVCDLWENISLQKEARRRSIESAILDMSKSLAELTAVLKDDLEHF